jgi:AcrR family transcriptional regulator
MNDLPDKHRPGAYARGEDTRRRLIETAIEAFGLNGYDGTTTRTLTEQADVTLPSIQYYFGSKEGLYRAAIDHIIAEMKFKLEDASRAARIVLANPKATRPELLNSLGDVLEALSRLVIGGDPSRKRFITRAEIERTAAVAPLQDQMRQLVIEPCVGVVARLVKGRPDDQKVIIRTLALIGQVSVFCHMGARAALGRADLGEAEFSIIRDVVREHCKAITDGAAREGKR